MIHLIGPVIVSLSVVMLALWLKHTCSSGNRPEFRNATAYVNRQTGETFIWLYDSDPASVRELVRCLGVTAADPELEFDFMQADAIARVVLEKHGAEKP